MNYSLKIIGLLLGGVLLCFARLEAQSSLPETSALVELEQAEVRITGNPTGLRYLPVSKLSVVDVGIRKNNGDFVNYFQSNDSWEATLNTESYFRYNPKVVLYGKVAYTNQQGERGGRSAFIDPYYNPFDIVEYADTTQGKKVKEAYHLVGALGFDATEKLSLGLKLDYLAANYTKFKDLRHANKLLDLTAIVGLSYRFLPGWEIGANYSYRRSIEGVEFHVEGTADKKYESLINYGGFFGKKEDFGGKGYTYKDSNQPMVNFLHGISLQLNYTKESVAFCNDFTYIARDGYYGEKASSSVYHSEHDAKTLSYKGDLRIQQQNSRHLLSIKAEWEDLNNYETSYRLVSVPGGTNYYEYHDPMKVGVKTTSQTDLTYTYQHNLQGFTPDWELKTGYSRFSRELTALFYPYYREQNLVSNQVLLSGVRNWKHDANQYSLILGAFYRFGSGTPINDGTSAAPSETALRPAVLDDCNQEEFEYLTAQSIRLNLGLRYSRPFPKLKVLGYAAIRYSYTRAFEVEYLSGDSARQLSLSLGCSF